MWDSDGRASCEAEEEADEEENAAAAPGGEGWRWENEDDEAGGTVGGSKQGEGTKAGIRKQRRV